ncbi:MAG: hypothetical protein JRF59_14190 [Deltaproteobacteria bacterium]|nr:hypothetical protein [Deltaproteobacteria bacterium]MBW2348966.1 hypothetical protein [Deltaproteobacteria bacterium]
MKPRLGRCLGWILCLGLIWGCAGPQKGRQGPAPGAQAAPPKTLAVLPFDNNSVTDPERYAPLKKGLAAMLVTDLRLAGTALKVIERSKIEALLKEIALGQTGSIDQATAIRVGRILGAQSIAFGSFVVLGSQVRIDARIVKVETSEVLMAESITGDRENFLGLEKGLAKKIASSLKVALAPTGSAPPGKGEMEAALLFSKGVAALDRGDKKAAREFFDRCVRIAPGYRDQIKELEGV